MESFASLQTPNFGEYYAYSKNITSRLFRMSSIICANKNYFCVKKPSTKKETVNLIQGWIILILENCSNFEKLNLKLLLKS